VEIENEFVGNNGGMSFSVLQRRCRSRNNWLGIARPGQLWVDAVEKVGGILLERNNRIIGVGSGRTSAAPPIRR
jgi:hypothetical protein